MADSIKRLVIPKENLVINAESGSGDYIFRYRVISDDKNRISPWSSIYRSQAESVSNILSANGLSSPTPILSTESISGEQFIHVYWDIPLPFANMPNFQVYTRWGTYTAGNYTFTSSLEYTSVTRGSDFTIQVPNGFSGLNIAVQLPTYPRTPLASAQLFNVNYAI